MNPPDLLAGVKLALAHLEHGDPCEAVSSLELLIGNVTNVDHLGLLHDARDEANMGSTERAEHLLEMLISDLERPVSAVASPKVDHGIPMPERFILAVGPVAEQLGIEHDPNGRTYIWDQQENKPVVTIHAEYSQAICLERTNESGFSGLADWLNRLDNQSLESENLAPSKVATLADVLRELQALGVDAESDCQGAPFQFITLELEGDYWANVGTVNGVWEGDVASKEFEYSHEFHLTTGISGNAINARDIAMEIARVARELSAKIAREPKAPAGKFHPDGGFIPDDADRGEGRES